jgi:hypothetical protein
MNSWVHSSKNLVFASFFFGVIQNGCIKVTTIAQTELAATEDIQCGKDIQTDIDASESIETILFDKTVIADCTQAAADSGKAIEDIITDLAVKTPNTVAGKQAIIKTGKKLPNSSQ